MRLRLPIAAVAAVAMTAVVAVHAQAQDVVLLPQVTGSIRSLPLEPAPVGGMIQSTYFRTTLGNKEFRRGFAEFQIPAFATSVQKATLVLTESRGWTAYPLPPDVHELSFYPADLVVSVEDYDRPTTLIATLETDANEDTRVFTFDVTTILRMFQGGNLGFRVKLALDPTLDIYGFAGSGFGELSTTPPRIEVTFGEPALTVPLDSKPSSCPNVLNLRSHGPLSAAILGTGGVNVVDIDAASVRLSGVAPLRTDLADVGAPGTGEPCTGSGPDGLVDLALKFDTQQLVAAITSALGRPPADGEVVTLNLSGQLKDGTPISGTDEVIATGSKVRVRQTKE